MRFWKSWGLKDSDIEGLQLVPFSLEIHVCMQTGIDESQLVLLLTCGEVTLGSTLDRGSWGYKTYFLVLASDLCAIPKEKTFLWGSKLSRLFAKVFLAHPRSPRNILRVRYRCGLLAKVNSPLLCRCQMQRHSWAEPPLRLLHLPLANPCQEKHWRSL